MSTLDKVIAAHDYIILNTKYDYDTYYAVTENSGEANENAYNAYGVFFDKKAVCAGYAMAFNALMKHEGIGFRYVESNDMNHAWSMVELDGKWYHVDCTWDDPAFSKTDDMDMEGYVNHEYFLLSDTDIKELDNPHYGWDEDAPKADSGIFNESFIKNIDTGIFFFDGRCYYGGDYFFGGKLYSNLTEVSDEQEINIGNLKVYALAKKGNYLYFSASENDKYQANMICRYGLVDKTFTKMLELTSENERITELSLDEDTIRYVLNEGNSYKVKNLSTKMRKIDYMRDIPQGHWAYRAIDYVMEEGIFKGESEDFFNLNDNITRAEFCQMIYNYMFDGEIPSPEEHIFDDVSTENWFYNAVNVCYEKGIIKGYGASFKPNDPIKREDASLIMMRIELGEEAIANYDTKAKLENLDYMNMYYRDLDKISPYAYNAMVASLGDIFNGDERNNINPQNNIIRAECAQMMYNYLREEIEVKNFKSDRVEMRFEYFESYNFYERYMYVIRSVKELQDFYNKYNKYYQLDQKINEATGDPYGFIVDCKKYDENYFKENVLILVKMDSTGPYNKVTIKAIGEGENRYTTIEFRKVGKGGPGRDELVMYHYFIEVDKDDMPGGEVDMGIVVSGKVNILK